MSVDRTELEDLLARYLELRERGVAPSGDEFARAHPEHERDLRAALEALERAEGLWPERSLALPVQVGRYRVLGELGRGGMGRVLRVEDPAAPGVELALKLLDAPTVTPERALERFRREGEILRALDHPAIVRVLDSGIAGRSPYLVMALVPGESLAARIARARERGPMPGDAPCAALELAGEGPPWVRVAALVAELARAVAALHASGVLHRDLKPANVLLTPAGRPVLVDFGLVHQDSAETLTRTGDLLGTPQYMSPEQARGERLDQRTDVYGLGCLLYELLTLRAPHEGDDPVRVLERVRRRPIAGVRRTAPGVPRALDHVVARALAHHRRHRTASAALLAEDLEAFVGARPVRAGPASWSERVAHVWTFRRAPVAGAALALVLALLVVAVLGARRERRAARDLVSFERAVEAWLDQDADRARGALDEIDPEGARGAWGELLRALVDGRTPAATQDPAIAAAVAGLETSAAGRPKDALAEHRRAAELAPDVVLPVLLLASTAREAGERTLSANEYTAAARMLPRSAKVEQRLAQVQFEAGRHEEALRSAQRAVELDELDAASWHLVARVQHRLAQSPEGLAAARRAVELAGERATPSMKKTLAALLDNNELHDESQAVLLDVIAANPSDAQAYFNLAFSYDLAHRMREAHDTYLRMMTIGQRSRAQASLAWLLAGAKQEECAECRAAYAADPALLDPARAEEMAIASVGVPGETDPAAPIIAAQVALKIGRRDRIRAALETLQASEERDDRLAACVRALRLLDKP